MNMHPTSISDFRVRIFNVLSDRESLKFGIEAEISHLAASYACEDLTELTKAKIETEKGITKHASADIIRECGAAEKIRYLPIDSSIAQEFVEQGPNLDWGKLTKLAPYAAFVGKEGQPRGAKKDIAKSSYR